MPSLWIPRKGNSPHPCSLVPLLLLYWGQRVYVAAIPKVQPVSFLLPIEKRGCFDSFYVLHLSSFGGACSISIHPSEHPVIASTPTSAQVVSAMAKSRGGK